MLLMNHLEGFFHLADIFNRARSQGVADDRLLCATLPPKGTLDRSVGPYPFVGLYQACRSRQNGDQRIYQLLGRGILDGLLGNFDSFNHRAKNTQCLDLQPYTHQRYPDREVTTFARSVILFHR